MYLPQEQQTLLNIKENVLKQNSVLVYSTSNYKQSKQREYPIIHIPQQTVKSERTKHNRNHKLYGLKQACLKLTELVELKKLGKVMAIKNNNFVSLLLTK